MKKLLNLLFRIIVASFVSLFGVMTVNATLTQYYNERGQALPTVSERREIALQNGFESYDGRYSENIILERILRANNQLLGVSIPTVVANFEDSLASRVTQTQTSTFTLVKGYDKLNRNLNGYYGFIIDEGSASTEEYFLANCVGTACSIVKRGIDIVDGSTQTSTLQHEHRRGASVKLTNFPQLAILSRILNGQDTTPGGLTLGNNVIYFSTSSGLRFNGTNLQWSQDGFVSSYNFTSTSITQLTASTSQAIGAINSQIIWTPSSTTGMAIGTDGKAYQQVVTSTGIENGPTGIKINTSTLVGLIATSTPTANMLPIANASGTLNSWVSQMIFGDGSDGDVTISATTTLTRDMYYNNLTINASTTLITNGYRVYIRGTLTGLSPSSSISWEGKNANSNVYAGAGLTSTAFGGSAPGGAPVYNNVGNGGANGVGGGSISNSLGGNGGAGGGITGPSCYAGSGGGGGVATTSTPPRNFVFGQHLYDPASITPIRLTGGAGGGAGGVSAVDTTRGGGSGGGVINIFAYRLAGYIYFSAKGGNGGGDAGDCAGGGGGGGGGFVGVWYSIDDSILLVINVLGGKGGIMPAVHSSYGADGEPGTYMRIKI